MYDRTNMINTAKDSPVIKLNAESVARILLKLQIFIKLSFVILEAKVYNGSETNMEIITIKVVLPSTSCCTAIKASFVIDRSAEWFAKNSIVFITVNIIVTRIWTPK
ncbi:hypothetical protein [Acetivibrio cellulolyticus]